MTSHAPSARPVSAAASWTRQPGTAAFLLGTGAVAVLLGVLTAYAQGWLPDETRSLANSVGPWALVAFLAALVAPRTALAPVAGGLCLGALVIGYTIGSAAQHHSSSTRFIFFWGAAAVLAGPTLGIAASWTRHPHPVLSGLGVGAVAGVLLGEGLYGLTYIADTTYPPYWMAEALLGVLVLAAPMLSRPRSWASTAVSVVVGALTALAFVGIFSLDLIAL